MFNVGDRVTLCIKGKKAEDMLGIVTKVHPGNALLPWDEFSVEWLKTPWADITVGCFPADELAPA